MSEIAINGELYSWSSVRVNLLGRNLNGIKAIEYGDQEEIKGVKGRGKKDIGYVRGNYTAEGKLTVEMSEIEVLNKSLPAGSSIQDIEPFDIPVSYVLNNKLTTHVLKGCKFMSQKRGTNSGEVKEIEVELPLYVGEIDWNS
ncbi:MAG: hypothetical protein IE931_05535 [Sphingobacteriales bacterium]|nr:hypothetical protein [Sphingobacteriales bacterium]